MCFYRDGYENATLQKDTLAINLDIITELLKQYKVELAQASSKLKIAVQEKDKFETQYFDQVQFFRDLEN